MSTELSEPDFTERDAIITSIQTAFARVNRGEDAISWNECVALDRYQSKEVCLAARRSDADTHWSQLVDDSDWWPFPGIGGFSFINAEGFQYYLPPTMIRFLRSDNSEWYPGHLLSVIERFTDQGHNTLWTEDQLVCIAHFIAFMAVHDEEVRFDPEDPNPWSDALEQRLISFIR